MKRIIKIGLLFSGLCLVSSSLLKIGLNLTNLRWVVADLMRIFPAIALCVVFFVRLSKFGPSGVLVSRVVSILGMICALLLAVSSAYLSIGFSQQSAVENIVSTNNLSWTVQNLASHLAIISVLAIAFLPLEVSHSKSEDTFS